MSRIENIKDFDKRLKAYHQRNTEIVQAYLRGVAAVAAGDDPGKDSPVKIRRKHGITRARLYQILKSYNVTANYVKYTRKKS